MAWPCCLFFLFEIDENLQTPPITEYVIPRFLIFFKCEVFADKRHHLDFLYIKFSIS
uniref:Uncharacterized protein n=1 Tax=Arundo donax TaxID=35708 RepID=A0A0A9BJH7_ARUDO